MKTETCPYCGKSEVVLKHKFFCGKNPDRRGIKKGQKHLKNRDDKTSAAGTMPVTSPQGQPIPAVALVSKSKSLSEINLKGEYNKMTETLNPKKEKKDGDDMNYKCGACGCTFNNLKDGKCPDCGAQLK
jgi:rubrerythrin